MCWSRDVPASSEHCGISPRSSWQICHDAFTEVGFVQKMEPFFQASCRSVISSYLSSGASTIRGVNTYASSIFWFSLKCWRVMSLIRVWLCRYSPSHTPVPGKEGGACRISSFANLQIHRMCITFSSDASVCVYYFIFLFF